MHLLAAENRDMAITPSIAFLLRAARCSHGHVLMAMLWQQARGAAPLFGVREEKLASVFLEGGNGRLAIGGHKPVPERHRGLILD